MVNTTLLKLLVFIVYFCIVVIFRINGQPITTRHHSLLRQHDMKIDKLNQYMNTAHNNNNKNNNNNNNRNTNRANNKIAKSEENYKQKIMPTVKQTKTSSVAIAEKAKTFLKDVFLRFRSQSRVGGGGLPACKCMWPEITGDGASAEQPCPPPPIKCEICMNAVNAVRYGSHPINYCGNTPSISKFYDFCVQAGDQMSGIQMDVHHIIVELTKRFGEEYGASGEMCAELGCCMEKPGHTPLPPPPVRVEGCMDSEAENYNPEAEIEDGSCKFPPPPPIKGCMNTDATNYNAEATEDDGSCQLPVKGCMDPKAKNYNRKATQDDGSCEYPPVCEPWLSKHQKGEKYDCHDNGRARDAGNDQKGIDDVLAKTDPFGDGRQVRVEKIGVKRDIVRSRTSDSDDKKYRNGCEEKTGSENITI